MRCKRCGKPYDTDIVHSCHRKYPKGLSKGIHAPYKDFGSCLNDAIYFDPDTINAISAASARLSTHIINSFLSEVWDEFMCIMDGHKDCKGHLHRK